MKCPRCQQENPPQAKFCLECATPLAPRCTNCGTQLPVGAKFCFECATPVGAPGSPPRLASPEAYTPRHVAERILNSRAALEGERKQVTVLFCDVVESTRLAEQLDAEAMHDVMDRLLRLIAEAVHRYGGTVNQFLGDGLMALFGAPLALEDHAVRGAHAALAILETADGFSAQLQRERGLVLRVRIGLNTGTVVVGKIGHDLRMDYTAVGDTTHLAARMQQAAAPGTIMATHATHRLVEGWVRSEPLGPVDVKGHEPVVAHRILGRRRRTRLEVRADRGLTAFVGRQHELALLRDRFEQARGGRGQVVGIIGEAGVGKSRLVWEFRAALAGERAILLEGACLPHTRATPYGPIVEILQRAFEIEPGDNPLQIDEKLRRGVGDLGGAAADALPVLRELFALPADRETTAADPQTKRRRTFEVVRALIAAGSKRRPHILVVEDLHWLDATSEEFLAFLVDSVTAMAVLLMTTSRPGYVPRWADRAHASQIGLDLLDELGVAAMIRAQLGAEPPDGLAQLVIDKAEGNPLFVEETVRSLLEHGAMVRDGSRFVWTSAPAIDFPSAGQDIIRARIDQLDEPVKRTLQTAAVIGRVFGPRLLEQVAEQPRDVTAHLETLRRLNFVRETRFVPETEYAFKHALIQDVAYGMLLAGRRRELHGTIARALEHAVGGRRDESVDALADHFSRSDDRARAVEYLVRAAERAAAVFANHEAVERFEQALALVDDDNVSLRASLHHRLAEFGAAAGFMEPDTALRHAEKALVLHEAAGDARAAMLMHSTIAALYISGNWDGAREDQAIPHLEAAAAMSETEPDSAVKAATYQRLAHLYLHRSAPATAQTWAERAVEVYARVGVSMGTSLGTARAYLGFIDDGLAYNEANWPGARAAANPVVIGIIGHEVGTILALARDPRRARMWSEQALAEFLKLPPRKRNTFIELIIRRPLALACLLMGDVPSADTLTREIDRLSRHGWAGCLFQDVACISLFHLRRGDLAAARRVAEETLAVMRGRGQLAAVSACSFVLGAIDLADGRYAESETYLSESATICRDGGNVLFELWVLPVLAELQVATGRIEAATQSVERGTQLLAPDRNWYGLPAGIALARGMVAAERGDWALADASFERALAIDRTFGLPWDEAKVLAEWGRVLRRRNIRGELERAREREGAACAIFERLGAAHELARLRAHGG